MSTGSTRLALAVLALAVIWIVAYWKTEAPESRPTVAFGEPPVETGESEPEPEPEPTEFVLPAPDPIPPTPTPSPAELPAARQTPPGGTIPPRFREHTVERGDTAESLSRRYYGTPARWDAIMRANPRVDFERLRAGRVILIAVDPDNIQGLPAPAVVGGDAVTPEPPRPIEYLVKPGDTLSDIAKAVYGRSSLWTMIRDANIEKVGRDGSRLRAGTTIVIPPLTGREAGR